MKFLIDANLHPRWCTWLKSRDHAADHVFDLDLLDATDTEIWRRGEVQNLVIVSKNVDLYDRVLLFGAPPQLVHVAVGNCSNAQLFELIAFQWDEIERALLAGSRLISITQDKLELFA